MESNKQQVITYLKASGWRDEAWLNGCFYHLFKKIAVVDNPIYSNLTKARREIIYNCACLIFEAEDMERLASNPNTLEEILKANTAQGVYTLFLLTPDARHAFNNNTLPVFQKLCQLQSTWYVAWCSTRRAEMVVDECELFTQNQPRFGMKDTIIRNKRSNIQWEDLNTNFATLLDNHFQVIRLELKEKPRESTFGWEHIRFAWGQETGSTTSGTGGQAFWDDFSAQFDFAFRGVFEEMRRQQRPPAPPPPPPRTSAIPLNTTDWLYWRGQFENCRSYPDAVKVWKLALKEHHSDVGGDPEIAKAINQAWANYKQNQKRMGKTRD